MKLLSIEPTPSPNSMKLNVDESLPGGERKTYTTADTADCPAVIAQILAIDGVAGVFHTADFLAVERHPKADWRSILEQVRIAFGQPDPAAGTGDERAAPDNRPAAADSFGEANVLVQQFRGIPMQVRVQAGGQEARLAMPDKFTNAIMKAQQGSPNLIMERQLVEHGVRYGDLREIAEQIVQELDASYTDDRLDELVKAALAEQSQGEAPPSEPEPADVPPIDADTVLHHPDWKQRYAEFSKLQPTMRDLPLIVQVLHDDNFSMRRLAVVFLGDLKEPEVLPHLYRALEDKNASVRRTAGDCLSDIGNPDAIGPMCEALKDPSKIVRWRAARFLYEFGDESALPALRDAVDDGEFEVSLQVRMALERIEGGQAAAGSVWQQMTRRNETT